MTGMKALTNPVSLWIPVLRFLVTFLFWRGLLPKASDPLNVCAKWDE